MSRRWDNSKHVGPQVKNDRWKKCDTNNYHSSQLGTIRQIGASSSKSNMRSSESNDSIEITSLSDERFRNFSAEMVAKEVVEDSLLYILRNKESTNNTLDKTYAFCSKLFHDPMICSAIISPLVVDVSAKAGESLVPNPIGCKLISLLQERLPRSCSTLINLLSEIRKRSIENSILLHFPSLVKYFTSQLNKEGYKGQVLELLKSTLTTYPDSCKELKSLILGNRISPKCITLCGISKSQIQDENSLLIDSILCKRNVRLVSSCIGLFLCSFPLELWLNPDTIGSMRLFSEYVKGVLVRLIHSIICCFDLNDEFLKLVVIVLTRIPYVKDINDNLTNSSIKLVAKMGTMIMRDKQNKIINCLCDCTGGQQLPQGGLSSMATPLALWIESSSSLLFKSFLVDQSFSKEARKINMLLGAIIKMHPTFLDLSQLKEVIDNYLLLHSSREDGMILFINFINGRSICPSHIFERLSGSFEFIMTKLNFIITSDKRSKVRQLCLQGYCNLLPIDWTAAIHCNKIRTCICSIKVACLEGGIHEQSLAFKTVGEMVIKCFTQLDDDVSFEARLVNICQEATPLMESGMEKSVVSTVKAMAIFATGNLAFAIRERNSAKYFVSLTSIQSLLCKVCYCLNDDNEKVVGNAIRAVGHLIFVVFNYPYADSLGSFSESKAIFTFAIRELYQKVSKASKENSTSLMTWKERSTAKKHGWGACHALGHLMTCDLVLSNENFKRSQEACVALVSCIKNYQVIDKKIVIAAGVALKRIEHFRLEILCRRTETLGVALSSCLNILFGRESAQKLEEQAESVIIHILPIVSVLDVLVVLRSIDFNTGSLQNLYRWMLHNIATGEVFEKFAMALEEVSDFDIRLEQQFACRAAWLDRKEAEKERFLHDDEL